jgi:hypothetical protein
MKLFTRSPLVCLVAASLALGTVRGAGGAPQKTTRPKTPPPKTSPAPPAEAAPARFDFEKRTGALEEALTVLLDRRRPVVPKEADERMAREAAARQVVRSNAAAAADMVIAELERLPKDDIEGHAELFSLLGVVADQDAAIDYWSKTVNSGTPRPARARTDREKLKEPDQPRGQRSEHEDPEVVIRYLAMAHLYRAARSGSEKARAAILEAAASPHPQVRISAVQYTYALTRRRWKARQELEKRLPRSDQYLLERY